jgi:hypothetical protein
MKKVLQNRSEEDEKRMLQLEEQLKDARNHAEDADKKYEEVSQEFCGGGQTGSTYEEVSQKQCRGGEQEVQRGES